MIKKTKEVKMVKLVIDIPKEMYERIKDGYVPLGISKYLKNGTPLPKGHGDLIDRDALKDCEYHIPHDIYANYTVVSSYDINDAPTIIEADGDSGVD